MDANGSFLGVPIRHASDAARRASEAINVHISALGHEAFGKWVAVRLSDGSSDGVLYDHRREAVSHQFHESQCAYIRIPPFGQFIQPFEAEAMLTYHRSCYDAGYRVPDPEAPAPIVPLVPVAAPRRGSRLALPYRGEWR
jgi:hypothetical protein